MFISSYDALISYAAVYISIKKLLIFQSTRMGMRIWPDYVVCPGRHIYVYVHLFFVRCYSLSFSSPSWAQEAPPPQSMNLEP